MGVKEFILQGLSPKTHGAVVGELYDIPDIQRSIISVAFLTESGVDHIAHRFMPHVATATVFGGIRNDITSYQGMRRLFESGVALHAVDTGTRHVLFHPKLYYVRGISLARLSIGSANLTLGGLNNNIEASVVLDFDPNDGNDAKFLKDLEDQFDGLPAAHPNNIYRIADLVKLAELLDAGLLIDEMATPPPRLSKATSNPATPDPTPRIKLAVPQVQKPPKMASAPTAPVAPPIVQPGVAPVLAPVKTAPFLPTSAAPVTPAAAPIAPVPPGPVAMPVTPITGFDLMWISKDLTERDLSIPTGANTNPTGSINLDKGLMAQNVDHRDYFRTIVFPALNWTARSATVDEAQGRFDLVLKNVYLGTFDMLIRHTNSTNTTSYQQFNAMTRLSWGKIAQYVKQPSLVGRAMALYRDRADPTHFMIEID